MCTLSQNGYGTRRSTSVDAANSSLLRLESTAVAHQHVSVVSVWVVCVGGWLCGVWAVSGQGVGVCVFFFFFVGGHFLRAPLAVGSGVGHALLEFWFDFGGAP